MSKLWPYLPVLFFVLRFNATPQAPSASSEEIEERIFQLVNAERAEKSLPPYRHSPEFQNLARMQSKNMRNYRFFSHRDHLGRRLKARKDAYFPNLFGTAAENIAYIKTRRKSHYAEEFMRRWMASPGHRLNIMNDEYTHIGVGVTKRGDTFYATQIFGELIARMTTPFPDTLRFGAKRHLEFLALCDPCKDGFRIHLQFPDSTAEFDVTDIEFYSGFAIYKPEWRDGYFSTRVEFNKGRGAYILSVLYDKNTYQSASPIMVK